MKQIALSQGRVALIDDEDFDEVSKYNWVARKGRQTYYAKALKGNWKERKFVQMHNLIMFCPKGYVIDHIDRNGLNNQKDNLRICTRSQNSKNRTSHVASKYLGVSIRRDKGRIYWIASIMADKKRKHLGLFKTEKEAAIAYNEAAKILHGEFANLNSL